MAAPQGWGEAGARRRPGLRGSSPGEVAIIALMFLPGLALVAIMVLEGAGVTGPGLTAVALPIAVVVIPIVFVAGVVLLVVRITRADRDLRAWQARHGWQRVPVTATLLGRWRTPGFTGGNERRVTEAMSRTGPRGWVYSFVHLASQVFHVVMTARPVPGPRVHLTPEAGWDKVAPALGGEDLQVESVDFNARWRIQGDDPRYTHAVLSPRFMDRLMRADADGLAVLLEGADVAVHAPGRTDPDRVEAMATLVLDLRDLLPTFAAPPEVRRAGAATQGADWVGGSTPADPWGPQVWGTDR